MIEVGNINNYDTTKDITYSLSGGDHCSSSNPKNKFKFGPTYKLQH